MKKISQLLSVVLVLILCLSAMASCKSRDPLAKTEFASLRIDGKDRINASITLDIREEEKHAGEKVCFYEARPGETAEDALRREPLDEAKVGPELKFRFPLYDENGRSRLYSSFFAAYENGKLLFEDGFYIENPQILAKNTSPFAWENSPKAILNPDANDAASMSVAHAVYEVKFSELLFGKGSFDYEGKSYSLSEEVLAKLDKQVKEATDAGMQVSLTVTPDVALSDNAMIAATDMLSARYAGEDKGLITAIFLRTVDVNNASKLCRLTSLALRSHVANGRLYVIAPAMSMSETQSFFENLRLDFAASGEILWGAAVSPQVSDLAPWEETETEHVSPSKLAELSSLLYSAPEKGRISYFALCDVAYSAKNEERQATCFAYTYFSAVAANAGMIVYRDHLNAETGLRDANGESRRILSVMKDIDSGLSAADRRMCENAAGKAWNNLKSVDPSRVSVNGTANVGTTGLAEDLLFDFSTGETLGFVGAGAIGNPESRHSAAWNQPTLYTWLDPTDYAESGVRKILRGNEIPNDTTSLSIRFLTQIPDSEECRFSLRLEGINREGQHLTYENSIDVSAGKWQTVTFGISAFSAELDHSMPCVMTLTAEPLSETDRDYTLWIRNVNTRLPESDTGSLWAIAIVLSCAALGFLIVILLYRRSASVSRRPRRRR
ncbi:MAG: hypothetical protein IKJ35_02790 [Clostridia bacterium]|nr:hypothetical protein [Clostridia bacterium]